MTKKTDRIREVRFRKLIRIAERKGNELGLSAAEYLAGILLKQIPPIHPEEIDAEIESIEDDDDQ